MFSAVILIVSALIILLRVEGNVPNNQYSVEVIEIECNNTAPDYLEMDWRITRPARGVLAVSGFINFKRDINTDTSVTGLKVYYSANGISYTLSPFCYPPQRTTNAINDLYKPYIMEALEKFCENALTFEVFESPITKRMTECKDFKMPKDNMPSYMRMGYYRIELLSEGEVGFSLKFLLRFERI